MHGQFDREHNFHIHEPHAHQIHHTDMNSIGDQDTFLIDWLVEGAVFFLNWFS